ncbi:MAG: hypothetical protein MR749_07215 [Succinatimonas hippei]|nr:hypothetical protein [Succinatimonas hippei]
MCLILCSIAAFLSLYLSSFKLKLLPTMYISASIMWTVDNTISKLSGEDFFDFSLDDTLLGFCIVVSALMFTGFVRFFKKIKKSYISVNSY